MGISVTQRSTFDPASVDLTEPDLYDDPWEFYRWLRDDHPVCWNGASGLYAISRYQDVLDISCHPEIYSSAKGVRPIPRKISLIDTDDPEHARLRRLVSRGFTPRQVRALEGHVRELTNQIIDEIQARGEIEFVSEFAIHVPTIVIAELMGLDPASRLQLYQWTDAMMAGDAVPDDADSPIIARGAEAFLQLTAVISQLVEERRNSPQNDLISVLTKLADDGVDGKPDILTDAELLMFCALLIVAGNDTTRNAITGALRALSLFPGERAKLIADPSLVSSAVEEVLRWVSPVLTMVRTLTTDHTRHGVDLRAGDRVLLLYQSANHDERAFEDPGTFRVDRSPNPHLAFGYGSHLCLGAHLARLEVEIVLGELLRRLPDIRLADPSAPLVRGDSTLVLSIKSAPAVFTPRGPR
jgi:cytochrome P450 family 142 subfamily A polypeptide 1